MPKLTSKEREVRFKISEEKFDLILKHAERHDETVSAFARHEVLNKVNYLEAQCEKIAMKELTTLLKSMSNCTSKKEA